MPAFMTLQEAEREVLDYERRLSSCERVAREDPSPASRAYAKADAADLEKLLRDAQARVERLRHRDTWSK